jgi:hypothetical protein
MTEVQARRVRLLTAVPKDVKARIVRQLTAVPKEVKRAA